MYNKGFTLMVAIVIAATLLLVSVGISSVAYRESILANSSRDSQYAFYAADTGIECALYWDIKNPTGISAFATSSATSITCNKDSANQGNQFIVGGTSQSVIFPITFLPDTYCAKVTVTKGSDNTTKIESQGYNTCDTSNPRRVERAVRLTY